LCDMVKHTSLCGLGKSAPYPVFSTLRHFREEYIEQLRDRPMPNADPQAEHLQPVMGGRES
ncbi:MAG: NADH-ubiquinone oxidoreductase-F iron-sulfur binding region domain-containing protein, partial [Cyanobacteria bacterium J06648_11]